MGLWDLALLGVVTLQVASIAYLPPVFFSPSRASLAPRIHQPLTNDIRRGYNSHRQGDLYRARSARH